MIILDVCLSLPSLVYFLVSVNEYGFARFVFAIYKKKDNLGL